MYSISFIGAGNVAFRLSLALQLAGHSIDFICNRDINNGNKLVKAINKNGGEAKYTNDYKALLNSEVVIISVSDDAIEEVTKGIAASLKEVSLGEIQLPNFFHTSGATDIKALSTLMDMGFECGVLYPLMTISKSKNINFSDVPFLLESTSQTTKRVLEGLTSSLNSEYFLCNSEKRLRMHTAAVFSCNFINYLLGLSFEVAGNAHTLLLPSTLEMVRKSFLLSPEAASTGPAKRGDLTTINKHIDLLEQLGLEEHKEIYKLLSDKIIKKYNK